MNRRQFLGSCIKTAGGILLPASTLFTPTIACASTDDYWIRDRIIWLRRKETGEEFRVVFWSDGAVDVDNYIRLCYLLRDTTESATVMMDVNLLNLIYGIQYWQELLDGRPSPYIVHSGYRTVNHNNHTEGAAKNSMHLYGRATDGGILRVPPNNIAKMATFFKFGGVGSYDTFSHIDTGRVRYWDGSKHRRDPAKRLATPLWRK